MCDTSAATATFAADRFGADAAFTDVAVMLDAAELDVVHVLTPPHTHTALVEQSLSHGCHVVCEKPLAPTAAQAAHLLDVAARVHREVAESRNLLWNDNVIAIDQLVAAGRLGEVREVEILLSLDMAAGPFGDLNLSGPGVRLAGGAVHDFLPHLTYLTLHFLGDPPDVDSVCGRLENLGGNVRVGYDSLDALISSGHRRARIRVASDLHPDCFRLAVRGTRGAVESDFYNPYLRLEGGTNVGKRAPFEQMVSGVRLARSGVRNLRDKVMQHGTYHGLPRMLDAWYDGLGSGRSPISAEQMLANSRLIDRLVALAIVPATAPPPALVPRPATALVTGPA